jgi:UDP-N-acetylmuramoyl-L-alanyl-D-glutamate--2,6-diaminopimelate ligase
VTGIQHDSREVQPGDLFVAARGRRYDGARFAAEAVEAGAVAVLASRPPEGPTPVPWVVAENPRALMGPLAARLYNHPDRELVMIGVTGTNGKTTCVWLLESVLAAAGIPTGKIGTVESDFRELPLASARTTPEATDLLRFLRELRDRGAAAVAMEVSSQGLVQGRVNEIEYDVALFTHLTRDHLDFHETMEAYYAAKRRLFDQLAPGGRGVVNVACPWGQRLAAELDAPITFGNGGDVQAVEAALHERGLRVRIRTPSGELELESPLFGDYNLHNLRAAAAAAEALELPREAVVEGVRRMRAVPGRMEPVECGQRFPVYLDYAHTDDALERLYSAVRRLTGRTVVGVFGCPGDRDRGKRELMGRVAGRLARQLVITTDNPRSEDPLAIMAAVARGAYDGGASPARASARVRTIVSMAPP